MSASFTVEMIKKMYAWERFVQSEDFVPMMEDVGIFYEEEGRYLVQDYRWRGNLERGFYSNVQSRGDSVILNVGNRTSYAGFYNEGEESGPPPLTGNVKDWIEDHATDRQEGYVNKMHKAMNKGPALKNLKGYVDRMEQAGEQEGIMQLSFDQWLRRNNFS